MATEIMGPAGQLHVDDGGTGGLPVVFVHSFAGSTAHWAEQLAHLRPPRRVPLQQADQIMSQMTSNYEDTTASYWDRLLANATPATRARVEGDRDAMPRSVALALIRSTFAYDPLPGLRDYPGIVMTTTI